MLLLNPFPRMFWHNEQEDEILHCQQIEFLWHQVEVVMVDSGCSTLLLPLKDGELVELPRLFPFDDSVPYGESHKWSVTESTGVAHKCLTLSIKERGGHSIQIDLCRDIIQALYFSLRSGLFAILSCTDDLALLVSPTLRSSLFPTSLQLIDSFQQRFPQSIVRKRHGLLGQSVIAKHAIQHGRLLAVVTKLQEPEWFSMDRLQDFLDQHTTK